MKTVLTAIVASLCLFVCESSLAADAQERVVAHTDNDGVQRVRIVGGNYFFRPRHIVVRVNVPVELSVSKEEGVVPHSFAIDAPQAGIVIDEEIDTTGKKIAFTPTAVGSYPFYCRHKLLFFKSHRERGMEGVLEVVP